MPPLHALAAFEAAARLRSFGRAAEELYLTHSAVSHRIRLLEEHLQTPVFLRLNKRVVLTPKGEVFLKTVREALMRLHEASVSLRDNARNSVRISVLPAFASRWLIQRVGDFYRQYSDIELEIQTTAQTANLKAGEADVGIRLGAGCYPGLEAQQLFSERMFPVASPDYLRAVGTLDSPQHLQRAVLLRNRRLPWKPWFDAAGLDWPEPLTGPIFSDVGFLLDAAVSGQGVALGRSSLVEDQLREGKLVKVAGVAAPSEWNFYVVHLPASAVRPEVRAFVQWLVRKARAETHQPICEAAEMLEQEKASAAATVDA